MAVIESPAFEPITFNTMNNAVLNPATEQYIRVPSARTASKPACELPLKRSLNPASNLPMTLQARHQTSTTPAAWYNTWLKKPTLKTEPKNS